jgi:hypothetical protein
VTSFEEQFPSLHKWDGHTLNNHKVFCRREIIDSCLDKQRVRDVILKPFCYAQVSDQIMEAEIRGKKRERARILRELRL